jgi:integrase
VGLARPPHFKRLTPHLGIAEAKILGRDRRPGLWQSLNGIELRLYEFELVFCPDQLTISARRLSLPKSASLPRGILTTAQARRLMGAPDPASSIGLRDRAILELLYGTGLRLGEAVRTDVTDLDLRSGLLLVRNGEGRKDRLVPVCGGAATALDRYLGDSRPDLLSRIESALFLSRDGSRLGVCACASNTMAVASPSPSPRTDSDSCATHLLRGGADLRHVQALRASAAHDHRALHARGAHRSARGRVPLSPANARPSPARSTVESIVFAVCTAQPTQRLAAPSQRRDRP